MIEVVFAKVIFGEVGYVCGLYMRDVGRGEGADVHDFLFVGCGCGWRGVEAGNFVE